jgi:dienelactone hydrolase
VDTPPALMLALDYLLRRPDVDSARVEGIGVSLGAPFVVIAGALDPRIRRVWVVHGSGGSFVPLQHNMREMVRFAPLRYVAAAVANTIIAGPRLAPERWVGRTAGQEFVMINAAGDERMPAAAVRSLFAAAAEPKQMIWMPGGHVRSVTEAVRPLVDTVMTRIATGPAPD